MSRARPWRVSTAMDRDTELALVDRLRRGDADAFDAVHLAFNRLVFTFLVRLSRRRDVAEDLLEETWLRFVKHATRLRADTRLGPWLFTVARKSACQLSALPSAGRLGRGKSDGAHDAR